jgi:hypothetical protein
MQTLTSLFSSGHECRGLRRNHINGIIVVAIGPVLPRDRGSSSARLEGVNTSKLTIPLRIQIPNGPFIHIEGSGDVGQQIVPHYILSLHGTSISHEQLASFGECTLGIKSLSKLSAEILYQSSLLLKCHGYRFGQVFYQHAALAQSHTQIGAAAIKLGGAPPAYLNPLNTNVLRKKPIKPFIEQDEWRVVVFTEEYLNDNPHSPLQINVDPSYFYRYSH